jgi:hypothetical protein
MTSTFWGCVIITDCSKMIMFQKSFSMEREEPHQCLTSTCAESKKTVYFLNQGEDGMWTKIK